MASISELPDQTLEHAADEETQQAPQHGRETRKGWEEGSPKSFAKDTKVIYDPTVWGEPLPEGILPAKTRRITYEVGDAVKGEVKLIGWIGGGLGTAVYYGHDERLDRPVAVKVVSIDKSSDLKPLHDLQREARHLAIAADTTPGILRVYDFQLETRADGTRNAYIIMEYEPNGTLAYEMLNTQGAFPPARVCKITGELAKTIDDLADVGIIYGDIKPDNIFLNPTLTKLGDVGLSIFAYKAGFIRGTPQYMAPERLEAEAFTRESDIYSLAMVTYEMILGHLPYDYSGEQLIKTGVPPQYVPISQHTDDKDASALLDYVDLDIIKAVKLDKLFQKALDSNPDSRYHAARDFARDLMGALDISVVEASNFKFPEPEWH